MKKGIIRHLSEYKDQIAQESSQSGLMKKMHQKAYAAAELGC